MKESDKVTGKTETINLDSPKLISGKTELFKDIIEWTSRNENVWLFFPIGFIESEISILKIFSKGINEAERERLSNCCVH
jgi:hypothetical protein